MNKGFTLTTIAKTTETRRQGTPTKQPGMKSSEEMRLTGTLMQNIHYG